jgi:hypothetical protein
MKFSVGYKQHHGEDSWHDTWHDIEAQDRRAALLSCFAEYGFDADDDLYLGSLITATGEHADFALTTAAQAADAILDGSTVSFWVTDGDLFEVGPDDIEEEHSKPCPACGGKGRVPLAGGLSDMVPAGLLGLGSVGALLIGEAVLGVLLGGLALAAVLFCDSLPPRAYRA